jgi:hypothetical protein
MLVIPSRLLVCGCNGCVAYCFRAAGLRVLTVGRSGRAGEPGESASTSAAA